MSQVRPEDGKLGTIQNPRTSKDCKSTMPKTTVKNLELELHDLRSELAELKKTTLRATPSVSEQVPNFDSQQLEVSQDNARLLHFGLPIVQFAPSHDKTQEDAGAWLSLCEAKFVLVGLTHLDSSPLRRPTISGTQPLAGTLVPETLVREVDPALGRLQKRVPANLGVAVTQTGPMMASDDIYTPQPSRPANPIVVHTVSQTLSRAAARPTHRRKVRCWDCNEERHERGDPSCKGAWQGSKN
ncbi:hypothetical protein K437DRAFT_273042 [Tilletiaria anomala UBC 951]|uniref:Uncharacterized protein n=1 Tax=Tilletiaria anomala (strain ATCC 24038 / CBS 436.72 / UBC 951) TaxID=1037660 RepID=A0A066WAU7_TILAU|nr:uncharacterized protein K437DRAFT_273042 [Tilletiaria anomala UBC 951]KDN50831.1 hypothetical protein K437DRAFT_273042 [Tilletiaria anomala UBC 951]